MCILCFLACAAGSTSLSSVSDAMYKNLWLTNTIDCPIIENNVWKRSWRVRLWQRLFQGVSYLVSQIITTQGDFLFSFLFFSFFLFFFFVLFLQFLPLLLPQKLFSRSLSRSLSHLKIFQINFKHWTIPKTS